MGVLVLSALASVVLLLFFYVPSSRQLRLLQTEVVGINSRRALIASIVKDAVQYSQKDPTIDPILREAGINTSQLHRTQLPAATTNRHRTK